MPRVRNCHAGTDLTANELLILQLVGAGANNREIGNALGIRATTVATRLYRISLRLHTRTPAQSVVECLRRRWLMLADFDPAVVAAVVR